ncbi:GNAT family N-acetyltransferase [Phytohalomonas tamaricis]|uniref:GNAT family N-acetyltransferase n=1 Tax=Phytohalomonas tamaricis TaxID=2081032 RepID=UPI000D0BC743|nr:GNAT family N-acetyltransferase [Phytohalomonas tamaricis]
MNEVVRLTPEHDALPVLAHWHFVQWGYLRPGTNCTLTLAELRRECTSQVVPSTYAAMIDGQPVGSVQLLAYDMDLRPEWSPWLASVFVVPQYRRRGIASQLVRHAEKVAFSTGIDTLYLYTPDQQTLYERLGWRRLENVGWCGERVTVMVKQSRQGEQP